MRARAPKQEPVSSIVAHLEGPCQSHSIRKLSMARAVRKEFDVGWGDLTPICPVSREN